MLVGLSDENAGRGSAALALGDGDGNPVGDSHLLGDQGALLVVSMLNSMLGAKVTRSGDGLANKAGAGRSQGEESLGMHDA